MEPHPSDIYAVAVVLWECLTGKKYYRGDTDAALIADILSPPMTRVRSIVPEVPQALDDVVLRALSLEPDDRYADAHEMALELSRAVRSASAMRVATFVQSLAADSLAARARLIAEVECTPFDRISSTRIHAAGPSDVAVKRTVALPSQGPSTAGGVTSEARPTTDGKRGARPLYIGLGVAAFALTAFATGLAFERAWPRPQTAPRAEAPAVAAEGDAPTVAGPLNSASTVAGPLPGASTVAGPLPGAPAADATETRTSAPAVTHDQRPSADPRTSRPKRPTSAAVRPVASTLVDTTRLPSERE